MISYNVEVITPELAQEILDKSKIIFNSKEKGKSKQRRVRWKTVDLYVKAIQEGRWRLNGETIKLDKFGAVIDGQHRLWAVIKAGIPTSFLVVRDVDSEDVGTIDIGLKRSLENALQFYAKCYENGAAAVVKAKMQLDNDDTNFGQSNANAELGHTQMVEEYIDNEAMYNEAAHYGKKVYKDSEGTLKASEVGAIYAYLVYTRKYERAGVEEFFQRLCSIRRNEKSIYKITMNNLDALKKCGKDRINEYIMCWNGMIKNDKKRPSIKEYPWFIDPENY